MQGDAPEGPEAGDTGRQLVKRDGRDGGSGGDDGQVVDQTADMGRLQGQVFACGFGRRVSMIKGGTGEGDIGLGAAVGPGEGPAIALGRGPAAVGVQVVDGHALHPMGEGMAKDLACLGGIEVAGGAEEAALGGFG